jgi:hypothetical protein
MAPRLFFESEEETEWRIQLLSEATFLPAPTAAPIAATSSVFSLLVHCRRAPTAEARTPGTRSRAVTHARTRRTETQGTRHEAVWLDTDIEERGLSMAELTNLESKLGEVVGLAMAAQEAGQKVAKLAQEEGNDDLVSTLERMLEQAKETEERGTVVASSFEGKKTAILDEARDVKGKAQQMMKTYLDEASDTLDGFEFLTMAEAGEVGHWEILGTLNERARNSDVSELVGWALPIQQQHLETVRSTSLKLAAEENPNEPAE